MAATAIALNPTPTFEGNVLEFGAAVISDVAENLRSLVLLVVRLIIIGGLVAVGGFARS